MKKTTSLCLAMTLAFGISTVAQADYRDHRGGHYRPAPHHHKHHHQGPSWAGPAALLAITGLAIGAAAYSQHNVQPVYSAPPRPVQPPADTGSWYYCGSSGQYYPYVRYCPEGWQEVMPPR